MEQIPVTFSIEQITFAYSEDEKPIFEEFTLDLPQGVISFVGPNGVGKSTLLLLAGGRLIPQKGSVSIFGRESSAITSETERNRNVSFIYQNLEFETEDPLGDLLNRIYENGFHENKDPEFIKELITAFELEDILNRKTQQLSKGGLQRAIMAFSLLYGSKAVMMDEPIFALEDTQKKKAMGFMTEYSRARNMPLYYSAHELEITETYSDFTLLLLGRGSYIFGPTKEVLTEENLEKAFKIPRSMMYQKERLHRQHLLEIQKHIIEERADFN